jgi:hypothetical protein
VCGHPIDDVVTLGRGRYHAAVNAQARRRAELSTMWDRFPAVEEKVRSVYGLRLPRYLAVFCVLWASADDAGGGKRSTT